MLAYVNTCKQSTNVVLSVNIFCFLTLSSQSSDSLQCGHDGKQKNSQERDFWGFPNWRLQENVFNHAITIWRSNLNVSCFNSFTANGTYLCHFWGGD